MVDDIGYYVGTVITMSNDSRSVRTFNCSRVNYPFNTKEHIRTMLTVDVLNKLMLEHAFQGMMSCSVCTYNVPDANVLVPPSKLVKAVETGESLLHVKVRSDCEGNSEFNLLISEINAYVKHFTPATSEKDTPLLLEFLEELRDEVQAMEDIKSVAEDVLWSMSDLLKNEFIPLELKKMADKIVGIVKYLSTDA